MTGPLPAAEMVSATSSDGFIARADGDFAWLTGHPVPEGEGSGPTAGMAGMPGMGAIVMGHQSFAKVGDTAPWPYAVPGSALGRSPAQLAIPDAWKDKVRVSARGPCAVLGALGSQGLRRLYIDGGQTIRGFLAEGLVRRMSR